MPAVIIPPPPKPSLRSIEEKFVTLMRQAEGLSYVWGGKGDRLWTPAGLVPNPFPNEVFDCSGLVTTMLHRAGGPDLRATHGARQLREACVPDQTRADIDCPVDRGLVLRFYPGHVAFQYATILWNSKAELIEAAGGDSTTTAPKPGASVRIGPERRTDCISVGSLSWYLRTLGYA